MDGANIKQKIRDQIAKAVELAISEIGFDNIEFTIETPRELINGDFSANAAMVLAKTAKRPPIV
ncbi:MAG: arginine--tRNA ligase, partial [Clostridiaceae bacterium]|nr:arginine--tRNA ligase [Clostridiaceae bacterium]